MTYFKTFGATAAGALAFAGHMAQADVQHLDDVIISFSLCVGQDCVNGESFGFDTIRVKENNLRIHFQDTSTSASFPSNDWRLTANDSSNGGLNFFGVEDSTAGRFPFRIEAGAKANTLYVEADSDVGIKTANPVVDLHIVEGNTPTVRLEQDGSSGFTPQTWDVAGNEANFFLRDVTNGSKLFFRSEPGAPENSIFIEDSGDIGSGTNAPDSAMHVRRTAASYPQAMLNLDAAGSNFVFFRMTAGTASPNTQADVTFTDGGGNGELRFNIVDGDNQEMALDADGNLEITGGLITTGGGGACTVADPCDAVFDPAVYTVPSIEDHAALMWENKHLPAVGPTGPDAPINMTEKMLRMLNELEHAHIYIEQLNDAVKAQSDEIAVLKAQNAEIAELRALIDSLTAN